MSLKMHQYIYIYIHFHDTDLEFVFSFRVCCEKSEAVMSQGAFGNDAIKHGEGLGGVGGGGGWQRQSGKEEKDRDYLLLTQPFSPLTTPSLTV